jgi:hypothetical protein
MFNASVVVSEQMERLMCVAAQELTMRAINACAAEYSFDASEAIRFLGLESVKVSRKQVEKPSKAAKVVAVKSSFPLPYSGECNDALCHGLRQNNGLYTQCQGKRKGENNFCKSCQSSADKNSGIPEYGTIEQRRAVGITEYVDPKGRKPSAYTKIMKKYKVSQEQVLEEASKMSMNIDVIHFEEQDGKRGRPSSKKEKVAKEPKGAKGRPKKTKKVLEIEGDEEDLFATLVASANSDDSESEEEPEIVIKPAKKGKSDEEREAERIAKEEQRLAEKAEKEAQRLKEKEEKEAKIAAEKAEKEAKIAAEKAEKAAKIAAEKEAKIAAEKEAKAAKEAQRLKEKEVAKAKKAGAKVEVEVEDEEPDVVKKIEVDGKKYLKSKKTGIIYDYKEYTVNGEQVVVGKWNESKNKIDFTETGEESEEEYEEEE